MKAISTIFVILVFLVSCSEHIKNVRTEKLVKNVITNKWENTHEIVILSVESLYRVGDTMYYDNTLAHLIVK